MDVAIKAALDIYDSKDENSRKKNEHSNRNGSNGKKSDLKKIRHMSNTLNALCVESIIALQITALSVKQSKLCDHISRMIQNLETTDRRSE